ncbi:MAG: class I SAM-dependent methyltransferase [Chitinophagaceae bacterium]
MFKRFFQKLKFKAMARQLRKPGGAMGNKVGLMMNKANESLYDFTLDTMQLAPGERVLEIGFGNGKFFTKIFSKAADLHISGLDFSATMVQAARLENEQHIKENKLALVQGSSSEMPFADNSFDKIYCINVVYFWDEPQHHLQEIKRVLKPGGLFFATIRTKESMDQMPFTQYGFTKYTEQSWKEVIEKNHLHFEKAVTLNEPELEFDGKPFRVQSLCLVAKKI